jgi:hypothetical protein
MTTLDPSPFRVELGDFFLEQTTDERWAFGRGDEILLTGLSAEEVFLLVVHLRECGGS